MSKNTMYIVFIQALTASALFASSAGNAQSVEQVFISVEWNKVNLKEALNSISDKTDFEFSYKDSEIKNAGVITYKANNESLKNILLELSKSKNLKFKRLNKVISVSRSEFRENNAIVEERDVIDVQVGGRITDGETSEGLPGASITVKGTSIGTVTDIDGNYTLDVPDDTEVTLVISFVGYLSQEVFIGGRSTIDVSLSPDVQSLEEVIVVGYGTQRKANITGAVETVNASALSNRPANDVANLLSGQVPGLQITQGNGQPGEDAGNISIRGNTTFQGSNTPLIIVDGIESTFENVDPNDIANVTVLKDASAAAIYGFRGGNGVILINTKRGQEGRPTVNYNYSIGSQSAIALPDFASSSDFARLANSAAANDGLTEPYSDLTAIDAGPNTDWLDALLSQSGIQQNHYLSVSGGNNDTKYAVSVGYLDRDGLMLNTNYKRYSFRANIDQQINDKLNFGINLSATRRDITEPRGGTLNVFNKAIREHPTIPVTYEVGGRDLWSSFQNEHNSVAEATDGGNKTTKRDKLFGTIYSEFKIIDGLSVKGVASFNQDYAIIDQFDTNLQLYNADGTEANLLPSRVEVNRDQRIEVNLQAFLNYEKNFGDHYVKGLIGVNRITNDFENINANRTNLPLSNSSDQLELGDASSQFNGSGVDLYRVRSILGRVNYAYKDKYLFEASFRRDESSRFAKGNRSKFFPSFSVGWRLTDEDFINLSDVNLKVRASWGQLGNQDLLDGNGDVVNFGYLPTFTSTTAFLGEQIVTGIIENGTTGSVPVANPNITWETITKTNVGIDIDLLGSKVNASFDYFIEDRNDILALDVVPSLSGTNAPFTNQYGTIATGIEVALGYRDKIGGVDFWVNANLTNFIKGPEIDEAPGDGVQGRRIGDPVSHVFGLEVDGFYQNQAEIDAGNDQSATGTPMPGDLKYVDQDGDGIIEVSDAVLEGDYVTLGSYAPLLSYGLSLGAKYKGFDLSLLFQGVGRVVKPFSNRAAHPFQNGGKALEIHNNSWTPENPNASYPLLHADGASVNGGVNSFFTYNASYLRLKNLQFGYSLPNSILDALKVQKLRVYFSADNILTLANSEFPDGFDPEVTESTNPSGFNRGIDGRVYPNVKTFTAGVNITF